MLNLFLLLPIHISSIEVTLIVKKSYYSFAKYKNFNNISGSNNTREMLPGGSTPGTVVAEHDEKRPIISLPPNLNNACLFGCKQKHQLLLCCVYTV